MVDSKTVDYWVESKGLFHQITVNRPLIELALSAPILGLIAVFAWNRSLSREIHRRQQAESRLRTLANNIHGVIYRYALSPNGTDRLLYVSSGCCDLWEIEADVVMRDANQLWTLVHPDDLPVMRATMKLSARTLTPWNCEWRIVTASGQQKWLHAVAQPQRHSNGDVIWDGLILDISDRVKAEQQIKYDALHDDLTGLPNRSLLMERLNLALERARSHPEVQFAVLFLDLDNFKVVNDSLGHLVGDQLLVAVATVLKQLISGVDLAARLGGDEFVIVLEDLAGIAMAVEVAEQIMTALRSPLHVAGREVFVTTSIGIVAGATSQYQAEDLLRDADLAMYQAKHRGQGHYVIFDPTMHTQVVQRLQLENDLRRALANHEFVLHYQPIVNLETGEIKGFEVLLRWQHPQRGLIPPDAFIAVAEETGLIVPIGRWILHTACQQLVTWQRQFAARSLSISVNLSVKQLQGLLLEHLDEVLRVSGLSGSSLVLEITESMLVQDDESTRTLFNQVKARGIYLSIDDFGTGYSSLSYLHQLPVDTLKIDRTFISLTGLDVRHQVITESITALSHLLELNAIAEGIETPQQLHWLQTLGCQLGQGFLFSPPVPAAAATELLNQSMPHQVSGGYRGIAAPDATPVSKRSYS